MILKSRCMSRCIYSNSERVTIIISRQTYLIEQRGSADNKILRIHELFMSHFKMFIFVLTNYFTAN
jgi:hypothetical protein